jgi:hypothetical protein
MSILLQVELIGQQLPGAQTGWLGVQEKNDVRAAVEIAGQEEVRFQVQLQVEREPLRYKGAAVQGTAAEPFIYLSWGDWAEGAWVMRARSKIQLNQIPCELLDEALASTKGLCARLTLSKDGRPVTGSLKPSQAVWSLTD